MKLYVANAPLTIDDDGGRRVVPPGELLDPKLVAGWPDRGLAALIEVDKVIVYDTDAYEHILAEYEARFADKKPSRKREADA